MPRIPTFNSEKVVTQPRLSPGAAASPALAKAEFGQVVSGAAQTGMKIAGDMRQMELNAERTTKALEIERDMRADVSSFAETFRGRADYDKFEEDAARHLDSLKQKYSEQVGEDRVLQGSFERIFTRNAIELESVAKATKFKVMGDRAVSAYETGFEQSVQGYVDTPDENMRAAIRANIEIGASSLAADGLISEMKAGDYIRAFDTRLKTVERERKVMEREAKAEQKEAVRVAQEQTEQTFVKGYLDGGLTISKIVGSNLEGHRKEHWISKLEARVKKQESGEWKVDKGIEASLYRDVMHIDVEDGRAVGSLREKILDSMGSGLDKDNAASLMTNLDTRISKQDDPLKTEQAKAAIKLLNDAAKARVFSRDKLENATAMNESTVLLKRFIKNHPDQDPAVFVKTLLEPAEAGFIGDLLDTLRPGAPALDAAKVQRKKSLETIAGPGSQAAPPAAEETRTIRGKTYIKRGGQWFEK